MKYNEQKIFNDKAISLSNSQRQTCLEKESSIRQLKKFLT